MVPTETFPLTVFTTSSEDGVVVPTPNLPAELTNTVEVPETVVPEES
jgi:hypothetical protein